LRLPDLDLDQAKSAAVNHQNLIGYKTEALSWRVLISTRRIIIGAMDWLLPMMAYLRAFFLPRHRLALESVALRPRLAVSKRKQARPNSGE